MDIRNKILLTTVAEKVDVDVVTDGNEPKGVADQRSRVPVLADEDVIEEELNDVQDDESREIGIEMYIKRVAPLDIFASNVGFHQETVGDEPHCRCDACAQQKAVDKDCVDEELDEAQHWQVEEERKNHWWNCIDGENGVKIILTIV